MTNSALMLVRAMPWLTSLSIGAFILDISLRLNEIQVDQEALTLRFAGRDVHGGVAERG